MRTNNEVPYLTHCRFCEEPRSSTNPGQPWGKLRLVCEKHWALLWAERPSHRDRSLAAVESSLRWHYTVWPDRIYKIVSVVYNSWIYTDDQRKFAKKRVEKLLKEGRPVMLFYADLVWEEGIPADIPQGEGNELEQAGKEVHRALAP